MSAGSEQRKLAAIMFTDMVGYSALAQRSETLALELLEEHRRLLRELFPRFHGTEIKTIGDAFLIEFQSALEAAQCGIEIQRTLAKRNADAMADRRIEVKIGIHIGDVVHREGDVYGDGVNIASRIEPLAGAGGICISMDVERQIRSAIEVSLVKLAPTELKNIQVAMELFRVVLPWEKQGPTRSAEAHSREVSAPARSTRRWAAGLVALVGLAVLGAAVWWAYPHFGKAPYRTAVPQAKAPSTTPSPADTKSVAVLPFTTMSPEREKDEYLSQGITEHLCTILSQIKGLRVPGRTSCAAFKDRQDDIRKIGAQLNVATVLEGSVQRMGNQLRITAQLINVADGFHLWAANYDRDMTNIFAVQSDVAQQVAAALKLHLGLADVQRLISRPTEKMEAYDLYLQGRFLWNKRNGAAIREAIERLRQAIQLDPQYAHAYAGLADCYLSLLSYANERSRDMAPLARAALEKALALNPNLAEAHASLATISWRFEFNWIAAEQEFKQALNLDPTYPAAHYWYAIFLAARGHKQEAVQQMSQAIEVDPLSPVVHWHAAYVDILLRQYDSATVAAEKALAVDPGYLLAYGLLARAHFLNGDEARSFAASANPATTSAAARVQLEDVYRSKGMRGVFGLKAQEAITLRERARGGAYNIAEALALSGNTQQALDFLEQAYDDRSIGVVLACVHPAFDSLRHEARFLTLLKKMGFEK